VKVESDSVQRNTVATILSSRVRYLLRVRDTNRVAHRHFVRAEAEELFGERYYARGIYGPFERAPKRGGQVGSHPKPLASASSHTSFAAAIAESID
jgi:hypothetical protein